ncbi:MAG: pyruvate dehydrogenase complex dihydrolipoamide acetyltransferase [Alphaproteobacteria bacterium]|nr:pyruvate dehydrogenase complex dihydrolipoamide acetyltransferase [Alphaproteobacteria bacterium]
MPIDILMPALSPTMTEGKLAKWHKKQGDTVESGDVLAEIETDKAVMELEAVDEGTLGRILVAEGSEGVPVNQPIAQLLEEGEDESALGDVPTAPATPPPAPESPPPAAATPPPQQPQQSPAPAPPPPPTGGRVIASPLARRLASQAGLDLSMISGSGPRGRIVKADVEAAKGSPQARAALPATIAQGGETPYTEIPHSSMRKIIAERLTASMREAPHFYLTIECVIDRLLEARKRLNAQAENDESAPRLSVNDFLIRAAAIALGKVPAVNVSWTDTALRQYSRADVAVAVALDEGLVTPVIRDAGNKGLGVIAAEAKDLIARAREGTLPPEEFQGGTLTISNLGMFGISNFTAIINPPQACILAVGAGIKRPIVTNGAVDVATVMSCTMSVDHRAVDGATGAKFLAAFKALVEDPLTMLL